MLACSVSEQALAQTTIKTDGRLGAAKDLSAADAIIPANLGERRGDNLFHSFKRFEIGAGESATFTGPGSIKNVISRVTGGRASRIDGRLASLVGQADFWLINPNGVLFGSGAQLDVPAGFHMSTANEIVFADGASFGLDDQNASSLSIAAPESFGLLGAGRLEIKGSSLQLPDNNRASLVSSDLIIDGAQLDWRGGELALATQGGELRIINGAILNTVGAQGSFVIDTNLFEVDASRISALNDADIDATQGITVRADRITLRNATSLISESVAAGNAPKIQLQAASIDISDFSQVASNARGDGDAARVVLDAERISIERGAFVSSEAFAAGNAGTVEIKTGSLTLEGDPSGAFTGIASQAASGSLGDAGDVQINAQEVINRFGAQISSDTFAAGDAGRVDIKAGRIELRGDGAPVLTAISSQSNPGSAGRAGSVRVETDSLRLIDGGLITANTLSDGAGGSVRIEAGQILIDNTANVTGTGISSNSALGTGRAGDVSVMADTLQIKGAGVISSITFGEGDGGSVSIIADMIELNGQGLDGFSGITSQANLGATGQAGEVVVRSSELVIREGSTINSSTFGDGNAGLVDIETQTLLISGGRSGLATGIISDAQAGAGQAGRVSVRSQEIVIADNGQISSLTLTEGDAGAIEVNADQILLDCRNCDQFTGITSRTDGLGDAGSIRITANDLQLKGAEVVSSTSAQGMAGSVSIQAAMIELDQDARISSRSTGQGVAGNLNINANDLLLNRSRIETSGQGAQGGRIDVTANTRVLLENSTLTSTGIRPAIGASLITLRAPEILLNQSRVESLFTNNLSPQAARALNSGEANLLGKVTIISTDSVVAAGTSVDVTGLDGDIAGSLVGIDAEFSTQDRALAPPCTIDQAGRSSSFLARLSRSQKDPGPTDPLSACGG